MPDNAKRALRVFLCHASWDKPYVRDLYKRLVREGIDAWLDQEKLLPGQNWRVEIPKAVQEADVVVICLSNKSITKEGYIQKEIKFALDSAEEKPDGTIFLIPARIEDCPVPEKLSHWQWVDLFEENGYSRLLTSLRLRAEKVEASFALSSYEDADAETERRLDQYYTEGLAAFYTEDWNRACQRFQLLLRERPNHKNALEKLEEAERHRDLANLYKQAEEAYKAENWEAAIHYLSDLLKRSSEYKDAAQLLGNAKKKKQLGELYYEARKLHGAGKWQAVLRVFEQIRALEPNHPDSDGLLPSAQKEAEEVKRIAHLNDLYSRALHEMDLGKWQEARSLLEQVHKSQTGFLETERLLRKVEEEIKKVEEQAQRANEVNILYEQAHGLVRSKSWRKAQDKIDEIRKLNSQFEDNDGIVEKVNAALMLEEQEAQKQNQLAALYAESVRLLKEKNYAEALTKWEEVRAIDPKYPDRQWVQRTARKELAKANKPSPTHITKIPWKVVSPTFVIIGLAALFAFFYQDIISYFTPMTEFPVQIRIISSSDWVDISKLPGGGDLVDVKLLNSSPRGSVDQFSADVFAIRQSIENSKKGATVEMLLEATLTNRESDGKLEFKFESGCLGQTTVQFWNAIDEPVLVKTVQGLAACDDKADAIIVPTILFTEENEISVQTIPSPISYSWYFYTVYDDLDFYPLNEGWGVEFENDISAPVISNGLLKFTMIGDDPYLYSPTDLNISAEETPIITIRMRVQQGTVAGIFFLPEDGEESDETRVDFSLKRDTGIFTYNVDMSANPLWEGTITRLRLDPVQTGGFIPQIIEIDYIIVHAR